METISSLSWSDATRLCNAAYKIPTITGPFGKPVMTAVKDENSTRCTYLEPLKLSQIMSHFTTCESTCKVNEWVVAAASESVCNSPLQFVQFVHQLQCLVLLLLVSHAFHWRWLRLFPSAGDWVHTKQPVTKTSKHSRTSPAVDDVHATAAKGSHNSNKWSTTTLSVVGVERSMSETTMRTSKTRKTGAWCICNARKARPAWPSPHLGCVFVQGRRKKRLARPEGPSRCFGYSSFVEERESSGEARRAKPASPFLVASDQKLQILALGVSP